MGEFIAGSITGPVFRMADFAQVLFGLALLATFAHRRIGAGIALSGCAVSLPYLLCLAAPSLFLRLFGGHASTQAASHFHAWHAVSLLALATTVFICIRCLLPDHGGTGSRREAE
jgi:hypothetical protein